MGIYDRDYYRRDARSPWRVVGDRGRVVLGLVVVNVVVFIAQLVSKNVTEWFILDVDAVLHGQVWRLLTYAFLHDPDSVWHILFNMLVLWFFGRDVEELYGSKEFLCFYLVAAVAGGVVYTLEGVIWQFGVLSSEFAYNAKFQCLGASGAVMAVLVLCACHYPRRTILVMFVIPMPIYVLVIIWVVIDALALIFPGMRSGTAVSVHLAGAALAFLYYKIGWRYMDLFSGLSFWKRGRPRLRVVRDDEPTTPVPVGPPRSADVDEHLEAQVDAVLEKVSRYGQDSLTDSEREILFRASEVYKRRKPR